jgi:hypothetical protein
MRCWSAGGIDLASIIALMKLTFRIHAIQRMFERRISPEDVRFVVENGETIQEYIDDTPYPSRLVLGWKHQRPIHVVIADNETDNEKIIVTVYEPDPAQWTDDFKRRKR